MSRLRIYMQLNTQHAINCMSVETICTYFLTKAFYSQKIKIVLSQKFNKRFYFIVSESKNVVIDGI